MNEGMLSELKRIRKTGFLIVNVLEMGDVGSE